MIPPSIRKVWAIILNTFREAVRDRILYAIVFFAVLILLLSTIMDVITIGQRSKIIIDSGLASISIFGTLIAIFVGINLVYKEIDKRTIYTIVSKPVARWQFLLGKYFGLVLTLLVEVAAMALETVERALEQLFTDQVIESADDNGKLFPARRELSFDHFGHGIFLFSGHYLPRRSSE
jgi:hypothetical protein